MCSTVVIKHFGGSSMIGVLRTSRSTQIMNSTLHVPEVPSSLTTQPSAAGASTRHKGFSQNLMSHQIISVRHSSHIPESGDISPCWEFPFHPVFSHTPSRTLTRQADLTKKREIWFAQSGETRAETLALPVPENKNIGSFIDSIPILSRLEYWL